MNIIDKFVISEILN